MKPMEVPTVDERRALYRLKLIAQEYRKVYAEMPVQMQITLLTIAENPGITQAELCKLTGLGTAAVSRHFLVLGTPNAARKTGLDLITSTFDPMDRRKSVLHLTPKGCAVVDTLIHLIQPLT